MKKLNLLLLLLSTFNINIFSQQNLTPREISSKHNELIKDFFSNYIFNQVKKDEKLTDDLLFEKITKFLRERGYNQILSKNEAIKYSKNPCDGISEKIKTPQLKKLICNKIQSSQIKLEKIREEDIELLSKEIKLTSNDKSIIEIYNNMLDSGEKLYTSKEWEKIIEKFRQWYYPTEEHGNIIKAKWWQIVLSDAAGAVIGAAVGANPATCVGAATTLSTLVAKNSDNSPNN
ncbi:MAG: hypothetical protein N2Z85_02505 [Patescibacteria group bacterium]|nr:hypothetical protein [Patescibacteria group bacterium]